MPILSWREIVDHLQLTPHPEGGFFKRTYASSLQLLIRGKSHHYSTAIYYLLPRGEQSHFHRLKSDELWHFYSGESLTLVEITLSGLLKKTRIGPALADGEFPQHVVPANHWLSAYPNGEYSLVGCTLAPGFECEDFELGRKETLLREYPRHRVEIERLCLE
ncbi:MAG: cupin domain-containing protein [Candidatus Thiosymbion ectosymbiont of Robbea hypermnestra]|nr:cupin domain-containing protein [Candidatus Thiosymbion ectosymbiont of Robbea hypermnestra]